MLGFEQSKCLSPCNSQLHNLTSHSYVLSLEQRIRELDGESATDSSQAINPQAQTITSCDKELPQPAHERSESTVARPSDGRTRDCSGSINCAVNERSRPFHQVGRSEVPLSSCSNPSPQSSRNSLLPAQSRNSEDIGPAYSQLEPLSCAELPDDLEHFVSQSALSPGALPTQVEEHLIEVYFTHANRKYPFLLQRTFYSWYKSWKTASSHGTVGDSWQGFMVHMVRSSTASQPDLTQKLFAVSLLLNPKISLSVSRASQVSPITSILWQELTGTECLQFRRRELSAGRTSPR